MSAKPAVAIQDDLRYAADNARAKGQWQLALDLYQQLHNNSTNSAVLLNRAICHYALGQFQPSHDLAHQAISIQQSLWQARLIKAKAAKELGKNTEWVALMQALYGDHSDVPEVIMEYAPIVMNVFGNAVGARALVKPLMRSAQHAERASYIWLMTLLYDRPKAMNARILTQHIKTFAKQFVGVREADRKLYTATSEATLTALAGHQFQLPPPQGKKRVGFISGLLSASPVYFLTIHALRDLAKQGHELTFFDRGGKNDWATQELKALATHWVPCTAYDAPVLEAVLQYAKLDELFDLAGWTDLEVLKALESKPAKAQFKWVGGQSCTTGLSCFDGFVTDDYQTPRETHDLYTEPLISLGKHYVQYTPPPYMPPRRARPNHCNLRTILKAGTGSLGIVANPVKLSLVFLETLKLLLSKMPAGVQLAFIDKRYAYKATRQRIIQALGPEYEARLQFHAPTSHPIFLQAMNELDMVLDTFPYSGGLTICEAMHLNIPIHTFCYERKLFCERHVLSHLQIR